MKYVLITGASGGIGRAIALQFANEGYGLYLHYNENEKEMTKLLNEIQHLTNNVYKVKADLSQKDSHYKIEAKINHPIDVLVLNSGTSYFGLLTDMNDAEVEKMIQINLTSPILLTKTLVPTMVANKSGKVIVISSIWGITGSSCEVMYSTVKGGLNTFVKALGKELGPSGVQVNGIAPGAIATNMLSNFSEEELQAICDEIPMGRLGFPEEVGELVSYLASSKANYINGEIISINGAWHC